MRVLMLPHPSHLSEEKPSGIQAVVHAYAKYLPEYGVELVEPDATSYDLVAIHAGVAPPPDSGPFVSHCHGIYWTAHYEAAQWEYDGNRSVIDNLRYADAVTVPSPWVAENLARDMRLKPIVIPHGIDTRRWEVKYLSPDRPAYVLWNKNRRTDACNPEAVSILAESRPQQLFITTHLNRRPTPNIEVLGTVDHETMRALVVSSTVYLATTKETFGIGTLEAMASGKPILGWDYGGTADLVQHGVNGYLAKPNNYEDLANGLDYCIAHQNVLGENSRYLASQWTWQDAAERVQQVYTNVYVGSERPYDVSVVIPCYNKSATLERAVRSALAQSLPPTDIIIVDNNSTDSSREIMMRLAREHDNVTYLVEGQQGVAHARNRGIRFAQTRYICCLDADDEILPNFLEACVDTLRSNPALGLAYTKMEVIDQEGRTHYPDWPSTYNFDGFLERRNQVPTCCVFRRDLAMRLGGYRQRYAPEGAGAEDAEFWLRMGAMGYGGYLATEQPLFRYYLGGQVGSNPSYREADWLVWHPWVYDEQHPFASLATPSNRISHKARQYDEPVVSVVIPCEPEHVRYLVDSLDSLEAQTFRFWEAIVVIDGEIEESELARLRQAYPHAHFLQTPGEGAGAARNVGAKDARGRYLLFLDADDWLEPSCLSEMIEVARAEPGHIVYTDYIGRAYGIENPAELQRNNRLLHYEEDEKFAVILYHASDYDCERALDQPRLGRDGEFYIWNLISSLVPRAWHDRIGGFDEEMPSWEDWDYWLRMARAGACFIRIQEPLVSYRFYTGTRREIGRQRAHDLIDYLRTKFEGEEPMPCGGCGGRKRSSPMMNHMQVDQKGMPVMNSQNMVRVKSLEGGFGRPITIRDQDTNQVHNYGFRKGGETFLMMRKHAQMFPNRFEIVEAVDPITINNEPDEPEETPEPALIAEEEESSEEEETETTSTRKTSGRGRRKRSS